MFFFQLIRWKNLLMIVLLQVVIEYHLLPLFTLSSLLTDFQFLYVTLASLLIMSSGYIINDLFDIEIDSINKPDRSWIPRYISQKKALAIYFLFNVTALSLSFVLALQKNNYWIVLWFFIPVLLLFLYASWLKRKLVLGNMLVSLLVVYGFLIICLFENEARTNYAVSLVVFSLSIFAFLLNFAREVAKDTEDRVGDMAFGVQSIPVKYGIKGSVQVVRILLLGIAFLVGIIVVTFFNTQMPLSIYLLTGVLSGVFLLFTQLHKVTKESDFVKVSLLLKLLMLVGILGVFFIIPI